MKVNSDKESKIYSNNYGPLESEETPIFDLSTIYQNENILNTKELNSSKIEQEYNEIGG